LDILEEAIEELKEFPPNTKIRMVILRWEQLPGEDNWNTHHACSGVNFPELITMLEAKKIDILNDWRA
jgi:hypothetical protein